MSTIFSPVKSEYSIQPHVLKFLQDMPFYAEISRHLTKVCTDTIPTLAVGYDPQNYEISFGYNPKFCSTLTNMQTRNVIMHELLHVIFGHLNLRRKMPAKLWNVATDCAINSIILDHEQSAKSKKPLPDGCIIPGHPYVHPEGRELSAEEKAASPLIEIIENLPPLKSSEFYFFKILEEAEKRGLGSDIEKLLTGSGLDSFDAHDFWDNVPEDQRDTVETKIKAMLEKAVKRADASEGWGNIPLELQKEIRRSISTVIDWKSILRQFTGSLIAGRPASSFKRINRRFPYIHPGQTTNYNARLLIAVDQSGSVDDAMLEQFFGEMRNLNKQILVDYIPFDCEALDSDIVTWNRGSCPGAMRTRSGGTDFNAPTRVINDPKNRGRWNGFLIMTDGCAEKPVESRLKRGWIIGKNMKLNFSTDEIIIQMNDGKIDFSAWR